MSRRGRHGRHPQPAPSRPGGPAPERATGAADPRPGEARAVTPVDTISPPIGTVDATERPGMPARVPAPQPQAMTPAEPRPERQPEARPPEPVATATAVADARPMMDAPDGRPTCTTAQLRRFIKSRPWVPMHELRRRFAVWGGDDDVSPMRIGDKTLFVGLPAAEAAMMAELLSGGDVGYELSLDPVTPIIVGVYPMRPVPRS